MAGGGGGGEEPVVGMEDAVKLLVDHLVQPVLPRVGSRRQAAALALAPEKQETVARQVHATVLLYNYYHRKQFPQLDFADPRRFSVSASLAAGEPLLLYLNQVHAAPGGDGGGEGAGLSVTDKAIVEACGIAEALDATVDAPEMATWPISKVAVLAVDPTKKRCLIEHGTLTKGVWSILEKDITTASGDLPRMELLSSSDEDVLPSEPYMLQQTAYSLVEAKTDMKRTCFRFLEEHLVYSLSKKEATAKLFVVQYEGTVNSEDLKEVPLEDLISRMNGPIFRRDPDPLTTSVVEFYHILPYKEVLLNFLNRERSLESVPKEQPILKGKSPFKQGVKTVGNSDPNSRSTSKIRKNSSLNNKRKSEAIKASSATCTEHEGEEKSIKGNGSLSNPGVKTLKFMSNSVSAEATRATSGGYIDSQTSVQMDKNRTDNHNAQEADSTVKNHASESKIVGFTGVSGRNNSTYIEHQDGERPRKENSPLSIPDVETSKFVSNSMSEKATRATSGGSVDLQASVQMDKNTTKKHNVSEADSRVKNRASESKIVRSTGVSSRDNSTYTEHQHGKRPRKENDPLFIPDAKTSKSVSDSVSEKATRALSGGSIDLETSGQMNKNTTEKHNAPEDNSRVKNGASESKIVRSTEVSNRDNSTCTEHQELERLRKENDLLSIPDVETSKFVINSVNEKATRAPSGGPINLETSVQMDKNTTEKHNVPEFDSIVKNRASASRIVRFTEVSSRDNSTCTEHQEYERPRKENSPSSIPDVETSKFLSNSVSGKVTRAINGGPVNLQTSVQMDKNTTEKHNVPEFDSIVKDRASASKIVRFTEVSGRDNSTNTEHHDGERARKENGPLSIQDVETSKFVRNSVFGEATRAPSGGSIDLQTSFQMDKNRTEKHNAAEVDSRVKNLAFESKIVSYTGLSGSVTDSINDQRYALLQSLQKMRDDIFREHCMLGDRFAQFDMDLQRIFIEGEMTPRALSILKSYENNNPNVMKDSSPSNSGEGSQAMKRQRLTEATLLRNKCQELDRICRDNNWLLPRYTVMPLADDGLYQAKVHLICPGHEMDAHGDLKSTPREARDSAATKMLFQLHAKTKELAEQGSSKPDASPHDKTLEKWDASRSSI